MFVHLLRWWFPVYFVGMWVGFAFDGATTGHWTVAIFWAAVFLTSIALLIFREKFFLSGFLSSCFLGFFLGPTAECVDYDTTRSAKFKTYNECVAAGYPKL